MKIGPDTYVPSLRWRMGEYQALSRLSDEAKARVVPFIVVPEIEFDFEEWAPKKTVQEHVEPFAKRFKQKWGMRPAWIDVHPKINTEIMDDCRVSEFGGGRHEKDHSGQYRPVQAIAGKRSRSN